MIRDLALQGHSERRATDICIVGAGTAGIFIARLLCARGLRVIILEAGPSPSATPAESDYGCLYPSSEYRGAELGRMFGLGGTSAAWGGQLISMLGSDLGARAHAGVEPWPISFSEISQYLSVVRKTLGLPASEAAPSGAFGATKLLANLSADFRLRWSEWLPFKARNFAQFFRSALESDSHIETWLNATVTSFRDSASVEGTARVLARACGPSGQTIDVDCQKLIICAGALESTRLLLEHDAQLGGVITRDGAPLGCYFSDHLSATVGSFSCDDWQAYNKATAPVFTYGIMRTPRLELEPAAQRRLGVPSAFVHFTFLTDGDTGFDTVRAWLRSRQGKRESFRQPLRNVGRVTKDLLTLSYWRFCRQQLWIPPGSRLLLLVDVEQRPMRENRLLLASSQDKLGRRRLSVDWRIHPADIEGIREVSALFARAWNSSEVARVARVDLALPDKDSSFESLYDVYHPTGSIRMGTNPRTSVVDSNLRLWNSENTFVVSTATFPSSGSANPTFTQLALAARLADHLANKIIP